jgi:2-amino-4-hydroxy-6-hydroxymethyldihydropteridine diphosphokinase
MRMSKVVLLLGGNESETRKAFAGALDLLSADVGTLLQTSALYKSPPWGFEHPGWFLNQVVAIESFLKPQALLYRTQKIEKQLGRKRKTATHYEGRLIDIDILFVDDLIVDLPELQIPHPRVHLRRFTLVPLVEILPALIHPGLGKQAVELLKFCPDDSPVEKEDHNFGP